MDNQLLLDDNFGPQSTIKYHGDNYTTTKILLQYSKKINPPIKAWRPIFTEVALNMIVKYTKDYGFLYAK